MVCAGAAIVGADADAGEEGVRLLQRALAAVGLLFLVVTATPVVGWWALWLSGTWQAPRGETLIVLGADSMGEGMLGYSSYLRAYSAVQVWREGGVREVLILGRGVSGPMREYLIQHGVPAAVVTAETESGTTLENAVAARRLLVGRQLSAGRGLVLLSSDYHMRRAAAVFRRQGLAVVTVPFPDALKRAGNWADRWGLAWGLGVETVKVGWYRVRGWS